MPIKVMFVKLLCRHEHDLDILQPQSPPHRQLDIALMFKLCPFIRHQEDISHSRYTVCFKERLEGNLVQILLVDIPYAGQSVRRGLVGVILGVEDKESRFAVMLIESGNIGNERAVALKRSGI